MSTPGFSLKFNRLQAVSDLGFSGFTMVWKRRAFCGDPNFNSDLSPGRVTCGTILCPDGRQLPVSHVIARVNNQYTHHHYRLKTAAVFTFSATTNNYVSYPQSKMHMIHLTLVSPYSGSDGTESAWNACVRWARPAPADACVLSMFKTGRLGGSHAFLT